MDLPTIIALLALGGVILAVIAILIINKKKQIKSKKHSKIKS